MIHRILTIVLGMVVSIVVSRAQIVLGNERNHLDAFREAAHNEFEDFRRQAMSDFIAFVRNPWKEFEHTAPTPLPDEKPVPLVTMPEEDRQKVINSTPIEIEEVVEPPVVPTQPQPPVPIEEMPVKEVKYTAFTFFGTRCSVRFDSSDKLKLCGTDNEDVADALNTMKEGCYDNMIIDCLSLRDSLQLSDWAYLQMLRLLAYSIEGDNTNTATLLLAYMYMQSGYRMRLAAYNGQLYMLYASKHHVYDMVSFEIDGETYYGIEKLPSQLFVCQASFPKERSMSLWINTCQKFSYVPSVERKIVSKRYDNIRISVAVNRNLIDFYNTYPTSIVNDNVMTRWAMYANTPMEEGIRNTVYPPLKRKIVGMSQKEAVERLLNLVQTGLEYEYDDKVWGGDRAFFSEESLYYPCCDCEDRAILLTRLIRDILGLKCILVFYPGHLAAAIEFTEAGVGGDYIAYDGHKYVVADATYINAPVGKTMPGMDNSKAKVILLE